MTRRYHFVQADVFTDRPFGGNQLAVFTDARGLSDAEMQSLTREMNYSESTFVLPPDTPNAVKRVRIFTPATELPMAGHPTVGTAFVLAQRGEIPLHGAMTEAVLQLGIGPVTVTIEAEDGAPSFVWMTHREARFGAVRDDRGRVAQALDIDGDDIRDDVPMQVVSTGLPFLFVPLRSLAAAGRCRSNVSALGALFAGTQPEGVYVFTTETVSPRASVHGRMFAPHVLDIPEDPATGSAAAPLGAYLSRYGLLPDAPEARFVCEQGIEMYRPSQIHIEVHREADRISGLRIGGQVVVVGEGDVFWD
ncbi:MAG TPA: PhzF family phenazine biosynthesis protein [Anaerolineae bacterium]